MTENEAGGGNPDDRRTLLVVVLLFLLLAGTLAALAAPAYRFTGDTEHYVTLARTIASGAPYAVNGLPEVKFPPGFPLLLAPAALLAPDSFAAISRWAAVLASSVFILTWWYLRKREPRFALPIAVLTVCSIPFLSLATGDPMSEAVYLALTLGLLLWADRWYASELPRTAGGLLLGCLLVVALPAVRTIGIAAVAAAGIMFVTEASSRAGRTSASLVRSGLPVAAGVIFLGAWLFWSRAHGFAWYSSGPDAGYLHDLLLINPHHPDLGRASLLQFAARLGRNFLIHAAHVGELLAPVSWIRPGWTSPALFMIPILLVGWWQALRGRGRFAALYFFFYAGILLLWPYDEGARFLLPTVPLLWLFALTGLRRLHGVIKRHPGRVRVVSIVWSALAAIVLAFALSDTPLDYPRQVTAAFLLWTAVFLAATIGWDLVVRLLDGWGPRQARALTAVAVPLWVVAAVLLVGPGLVQRARGVPDAAEVATALREASAWINANTPADAVIQTTYTTRIHFATGRPTVPLPRTRSPEPFLEVDGRYHPTFLLVLESNDGFYIPSDEARFAVIDSLFPNRWQRVQHVPGGNIYVTR